MSIKYLCNSPLWYTNSSNTASQRNTKNTLSQYLRTEVMQSPGLRTAMLRSCSRPACWGSVASAAVTELGQHSWEHWRSGFPLALPADERQLLLVPERCTDQAKCGPGAVYGYGTQRGNSEVNTRNPHTNSTGVFHLKSTKWFLNWFTALKTLTNPVLKTCCKTIVHSTLLCSHLLKWYRAFISWKVCFSIHLIQLLRTD